jgi:hypothetical protein
VARGPGPGPGPGPAGTHWDPLDLEQPGATRARARARALKQIRNQPAPRSRRLGRGWGWGWRFLFLVASCSVCLYFVCMPCGLFAGPVSSPQRPLDLAATCYLLLEARALPLPIPQERSGKLARFFAISAPSKATCRPSRKWHLIRRRVLFDSFIGEVEVAIDHHILHVWLH